MDRRGLFLEAAHDKAASPVLSHDDSTACLCNCGLRNFELSMLASPERQGVALSQIVSLDLSCNELMELPGLEAMPQLEALDLSRNWFNMLPPQVGTLRRLVSLNASRNFLRPNAESLQLAPLKALPALRLLDLSFNQKCGKEELRDRLRAELPLVDELKITVSLELRAAPGAFVGASAAERDPGVLRSQLEPLGTIALRRRLVCDFGEPPADPRTVPRAEVMERLLACYAREGLADQRKLLRVDGAPVDPGLLERLLGEFRAWAGDGRRGGPNRERPSIRAASYMILRSPASLARALEERPGSLKTRRAWAKLAANRALWDLAEEAVRRVDPAFAAQFTELAVTHRFTGSPHIDKQNSGPFYGLALGDFPEGEGGVRVECSARVVCDVNTRGRLGRVDGRHVHWVAPYAADAERYSLIYYTTGGAFLEPGPAVFSVPVSVPGE